MRSATNRLHPTVRAQWAHVQVSAGRYDASGVTMTLVQPLLAVTVRTAIQQSPTHPSAKGYRTRTLSTSRLNGRPYQYVCVSLPVPLRLCHSIETHDNRGIRDKGIIRKLPYSKLPFLKAGRQ